MVILRAGLQRLGLSHFCCASRLLHLVFLVLEGERNGGVSSVSLQARNPKAQAEKVKCGTGVKRIKA